MEFVPFRVDVPDAVLDDLSARLAMTRWPDQIPGTGWELGADTTYLRELVAHWQSGFDWRTAEGTLNSWPQFTTTIDGQRVHFIHVRSADPDARPLLLTHGWPSTPMEFLDVIGPLTDPARFGLSGEAFHVVAPSMPGYGWSGPTTERGWHPGRVASAWLDLMSGLGYERFLAHGTDWGSIVSSEIARQAPERVIALHVTLLPSGLTPPDGIFTDEEARLQALNAARRATENGYVALQSSKPQTISHALADSPVAQAAWIVEKLQSWIDGDLDQVLGRDRILTWITTFWVTGTGGSSGRLYYEGAQAAIDSRAPAARVEVPTAVAVFPKEIYKTSERIAASWFDLRRWTEMPRGGHFSAMEQPEILVEDLRLFYGSIA